MWKRQSAFNKVPAGPLMDPSQAQSIPGTGVASGLRREHRSRSCSSSFLIISVCDQCLHSICWHFQLQIGENEKNIVYFSMCGGEFSAQLSVFAFKSMEVLLLLNVAPNCPLVLGLTASQGIRNTVPKTGDQLSQG